jgi:hypothetical protein
MWYIETQEQVRDMIKATLCREAAPKRKMRIIEGFEELCGA